jgi:hypothetical protein
MKPSELKFDKQLSYILVGNGPSLLLKEWGENIDQFDEVIRFNRYKIEGFEKYVGTKTTIWSTFGKNELPSDEFSRPSNIIYIHGEQGNPSYAPEQIIRIPLSYYNQLRKKLQNESLLKDKVQDFIPSSGVLVISWLLDHFLDKVTIVGFDNFSQDISSTHHYWNTRNFTKPREHDGGWERQFMEHYENLGKIIKLECK